MFIYPKICTENKNARKELLARLQHTKNNDHINELILKHLPTHKHLIKIKNIYVALTKTNKIGKVIGKKWK